MRVMAIAVAGLLLAASPASAAPAHDQWQPAAPMANPRLEQSSAVLADGDVLVAGGATGSGSAIKSAEIYDHSSGTWSAASDMPTGIAQGTAVTLASGDVLVVGGVTSDSSPPVNTGLLYDPRSDSWTSVTNTMSTSRGLFAPAVLMPSGKVLIPGGSGNTGVTKADVYDPATNSFEPAAPMTSPRARACAAPLPNGDVLVAGGVVGLLQPTQSAEVYDPRTDSWTPVRNGMSSPRAECGAAVLPDGRVIVAGGLSSSPNPTPTETATTDIYDPNTNSFTPGPAMPHARAQFDVAPLSGEGVVVTGGVTNPGLGVAADASTDVYLASANRWIQASDLPRITAGASMNTLPDGRVLLAGGFKTVSTGPDDEATTATDLFTPPAPPEAPLSVSATPGGHDAAVSFTPPADDGGFPVERYVVKASTGQSVITPDARTTVTLTGLTNGRPVTLTVTAVNLVGTSPPASATVVPGPPIVRINGWKPRLSRKAFLKGVRFSVTPNKAASLQISLLASLRRATFARAFRLTLASERFGLSTARRSVRLKPSAKLVGKSTRAVVEVVITATDGFGNSATTIKTIRVALM
jgi:hypothetical protein